MGVGPSGSSLAWPTFAVASLVSATVVAHQLTGESYRSLYEKALNSVRSGNMGQFVGAIVSDVARASPGLGAPCALTLFVLSWTCYGLLLALVARIAIWLCALTVVSGARLATGTLFARPPLVNGTMADYSGMLANVVDVVAEVARACMTSFASLVRMAWLPALVAYAVSLAVCAGRIAEANNFNFPIDLRPIEALACSQA